jgi:hypothetical protein
VLRLEFHAPPAATFGGLRARARSTRMRRMACAAAIR